jgi:hypothetical protein
MNNLIRAFHVVMSLLKRLVKDAGSSVAVLEIGVLTECIGHDGKVKWRDIVSQPLGARRANRYPNSLRLAGFMLIVSLTLVSVWFVPAIGWSVPILGRVATSGLNQLLDATLKTGSTSPVWYVGLAKQVASDGAITSGAATFTSASGTFVSGDIGRNIIVQGAGASGADLYTTISAVGSTTSITLAANAGTTVSGARYAFECRLADTMSSHTSFVESTSYSNSNRVTWTPGSISGGSVDNSGSVAAFSINASDYIFGAFLTGNNTKGGSTGTLYGMGVNSSGIARQVANGDTLNVTVTCTCTSA